MTHGALAIYARVFISSWSSRGSTWSHFHVKIRVRKKTQQLTGWPQSQGANNLGAFERIIREPRSLLVNPTQSNALTRTYSSLISLLQMRGSISKLFKCVLCKGVRAKRKSFADLSQPAPPCCTHSVCVQHNSSAAQRCTN